MASSKHFVNFPLVGISLSLKGSVVLRRVNRLTPPKYSLSLLIFRKFTVSPRGHHLFHDSLQKKVILTVKQLKSDWFALVGCFADESHSET